MTDKTQGRCPGLDEESFPDCSGLTTEQLVDVLSADLRLRWKRGDRLPARAYLERFPALVARRDAAAELVYNEFILHETGDNAISFEDFVGRYADYAAALWELRQADSLLMEHAPLVPSSGRFGDYELLEEIGRGGMGVVYLARQTKLNRYVALKMILSAAHAGSAERQRFLREAKILARLEHLNIVRIYDVGEHDGLLYFSMEFCAGGSLEKKLSGPLPPKEAAVLVATLARAIHAAHVEGVIHRDLKPANVLLGKDSTPKITDFGLAKDLLDDNGCSLSNSLLGTPSYMAPEQAQSKAAVFGPLADLYALGAILYKTLTGVPPFQAPSPLDTLEQVRTREPVPPRKLQPKLPPDLETICLKCLEKQPSNRFYANAEMLADDLGLFVRDKPIKARPPSLTYRLRKTLWYHRVLTLTSSAIVTGVIVAFCLIISAWNKEREARGQRNQAQVDALLHARAEAVPGILQALVSVREDLGPQLRDLWQREDSPANRQVKLRAGLALLPLDVAVRKQLALWLLSIEDPPEFLLVRDALLDYRAEFASGYWRQLEAPDLTRPEQFRVACCLAAYDSDDARWKAAARTVAFQLVTENRLRLVWWVQAFRPISHHLLPPLGEVFRDRKRPEEQRRLATSLLTIYAAERPEALAELVKDAEDWQFLELFPLLQQQKGRAVALLQSKLRTSPNAPGMAAREGDTARRQARAATALLRLGQAEAAWPLFRHQPDPEARSQLLALLAPLGVDPGELVRRLRTEQDVSARRALILALGEFRRDQLPQELRQPLSDLLLRWYRNDPDAGVHGAVDWLFRHDKEGPTARALDWEQTGALALIDKELAARYHRKPSACRFGAGLPGLMRTQAGLPLPSEYGKEDWRLAADGQTLTIVRRPQPFLMGSPPYESGGGDRELIHRTRINRSFAIGTKPVTVRQWERFQKVYPDFTHGYNRPCSPEPECPITCVRWYDAAAYCRWLSELEGVSEEEMCYPPVSDIEKAKRDPKAPPLNVPADYLSRTGYRLPTEAEWEYACRAGATTSRYYGSSEELLPRYAWYRSNADDRSWPVGEKRPNDLGLFDMHGNVWTWCHESDLDYGQGTPGQVFEDKEDGRPITNTLNRMLRGGGFTRRPSLVRSAQRGSTRPIIRDDDHGLRVARTCP